MPGAGFSNRRRTCGFHAASDGGNTPFCAGVAGGMAALAARGLYTVDMSKAQSQEQSVRVPADGGAIVGDLSLPGGAGAVVLFAHGSGSSRHSPRNRAVAATLQLAGLGTLLIDLLTPAEERADSEEGRLRFDIALLSRRLLAVISWLAQAPATRGLRVGLFGASTGAAAALVAAAQVPERVAAVVSRGGRPDLAGVALEGVRAPTLLVVGGEDRTVLGMNLEAHGHLVCEKNLVVIPGATHLFEEPGALEEVARLASSWFLRHLGSPAPGR
jgi:putative phosphoribosyl transferase